MADANPTISSVDEVELRKNQSLKRNAHRLDKERRKSLRKSLRNKKLLSPDSFVFTGGRTVEDFTGGNGESSDQMVLADTVGTKDLATLATLTEASVLDELKLRYKQDVIYTNIGDILIAINPFKIIPGLYDEAVSLRHFHDQTVSNIPHVFAISQAAYKNMLLSHKNQCCVISGESGSGKTETAKYLVEHLLSMCKGTGALEERIMQVNPLLEAFGNARTVINDNSSRFGKYLDIKFGYYGDVLGATLSEYLLEKSRIVRQGDSERNFHVFYYLFAGLSEEKKKEMHLGEVTSYHYLRGGVKGLTRDCVIDVNDVQLAESYKHLVQCMSDVGFSSADGDSVFELLAAVLQLGSIEFFEADHGYAETITNDPVALLAVMAGVDATELNSVLDRATSMMRGERIEKRFSVSKAYANRDAVAKAMYGRLFGWIVRQANSLLSPKGAAFHEAKGREGGVTDIGILDIFGFENFEVNSFEQLCINIANEQLQFYFNQHIFAWELSAYAKEGIDAGTVTYKDNRGLLDMLLARPLGIFALLDEESRFSTSTPKSLVAKFDKAARECDWEYFQLITDATARKGKSDTAKKMSMRKGTFNNGIFTTEAVDETPAGPYFEVSHYAGPVTYDAAEFLPKNRDNLSADVISLFKMSDKQILRKLFQQTRKSTGTFATGTSRRKKEETKLSVSAHFKHSLLDLMDKMLQAQPHFVRCLKPNRGKQPSLFVDDDVNMQLRYAGVVETTRIRRDGYAVRLDFVTFIKRFHAVGLRLAEMPSLDPEALSPTEDLRIACARIVTSVGLRGVQLGKTLVFLKYYHNEKLMGALEEMDKHATVLNNVTRVFLAKKLLIRLRIDREERIQAEKEKAEREQRERELKIRIAKEKAAALLAEQKAKEALERAAQLAKEEEEKFKMQQALTLKRAKVVESQKRKMAEEKKRQEQELALVLAEAEKAKKAAQELEEQAEREAAERAKQDDAKLNSQLEQAAIAAEDRLQRRRIEQEQQTQAKAKANTDNKPEMEQFGTPSLEGEVDEPEDPDFFLGLDEEVSEDQRTHLAMLAQKRKNEEIQRKLQLKVAYQEEQDKIARQRMLELDAIAEAERNKQETNSGDIEKMREESENRMAEMDFGFDFSFGAPATPNTPSDVVPIEKQKSEETHPEPPAAKPVVSQATTGTLKKRTPPPTAKKPATLKKKPATLKKPPPSPIVKKKKPPTLKKPQSPATLKKPKRTPTIISALTSITRRSKADISGSLPPPPPSDDVDDMSMSLVNMTLLTSPIPLTLQHPSTENKTPNPESDAQQKPLAPAFSLRNKKKKGPPPKIGGELSLSQKKKKAPPPSPKASIKKPVTETTKKPVTETTKKPVTETTKKPVAEIIPTTPTNDGGSDSKLTEPEVSEELPAIPPLPNIPPAPTLQSPIEVSTTSPTNPTPPVATATAPTPTEPGQPRRRKLVRGGNKTEATVLPAYTAALAAIDDLIVFLDAYESADSNLARKHSIKTGSIRRQNSNRSSKRQSQSQPPSDRDSIEALANVLLIGNSSPRKSVRSKPSPDLQVSERFATGAAQISRLSSPTASGGTQRKSSEKSLELSVEQISKGNTKNTVDIKGISLTASDILAMDEGERLQILNNVKAGIMSVDDAMTEVIDHKRRQNCSIM